MISQLTAGQEALIAEYRERYWRQAISTERADRSRAEAAARRLAEIAGVEAQSVTWVSSPIEGYQSARKADQSDAAFNTDAG